MKATVVHDGQALRSISGWRCCRPGAPRGLGATSRRPSMNEICNVDAIGSLWPSGWQPGRLSGVCLLCLHYRARCASAPSPLHNLRVSPRPSTPLSRCSYCGTGSFRDLHPETRQRRPNPSPFKSTRGARLHAHTGPSYCVNISPSLSLSHIAPQSHNGKHWCVSFSRKKALMKTSQNKNYVFEHHRKQTKRRDTPPTQCAEQTGSAWRVWAFIFSPQTTTTTTTSTTNPHDNALPPPLPP